VRSTHAKKSCHATKSKSLNSDSLRAERIPHKHKAHTCTQASQEESASGHICWCHCTLFLCTFSWISHSFSNLEVTWIYIQSAKNLLFVICSPGLLAPRCFSVFVTPCAMCYEPSRHVVRLVNSEPSLLFAISPPDRFLLSPSYKVLRNCTFVKAEVSS
jgi:hypothetical protein